MSKIFKKIAIVCLILVMSWQGVWAHEIGGESDELDAKIEEKNREIEELEAKLNEIRSTKQTLSDQITYFDNQIRLTTLKINQTEEQIVLLQEAIAELSGKIYELDVGLDELSVFLAERIVETYKHGDVNMLNLFLQAEGFSDLFARYKYVRAVQIHDKQLLLSMEQAKQIYDQQKSLKLEKQTELSRLQEKLDQQKVDLDQQKVAKETLLVATKNDEKKFQQMLLAAQAEQAAFKKAIADLVGQLKDGTPVKKGERIAVMGNSGAPYCSTAAHLHLEITDKNGVNKDPSGYLKSAWNIIWDNSPDGQFGLGGDWDWPMKNPRVTQGYGYTWWSKTGFYSGKPHTGIDMVDDNDKIIYAPKEGILYKGAASCRGTAMNYVAVEHDDVISWYWHVQ